jgi:DNA end-binding protein Ku
VQPLAVLAARRVHPRWRMARKKKTTKKQPPKHRASWKGHLSFGLVSFPVQAFNARNREEGDIHFHQLHAGCHRRIRYEKVCPVHGQVTADEIVSGYEHRKGKYIEIDPEELDALRTESERSLTIDAFVEPDAIDPIYLDGRMYYLAPDGAAAAEPYAVIVEAMEREERYGVGQVVFSGKDQLALVRPLEGVLHMAMLNYDEEIRRPRDVVAASKSSHVGGRKVQLAQTLVRSWFNRNFDFTAYDDRYREKVKELIDAKVAGRDIVAPEEEETPEVINLMDALKKSLAREGKPAKSRPGRRRKRSA